MDELLKNPGNGKETLDGWNGYIYPKVGSNNYCIGPQFYPGDKIKGNRDLAWEDSVPVAGKPVQKSTESLHVISFETIFSQKSWQNDHPKS